AHAGHVPCHRKEWRVDGDLLCQSLATYVKDIGCKKSFVLGHYEFLRRDCAVHLPSLARMPSLVVLIKQCPALEANFTVLRTALHRAVTGCTRKEVDAMNYFLHLMGASENEPEDEESDEELEDIEGVDMDDIEDRPMTHRVSRELAEMADELFVENRWARLRMDSNSLVLKMIDEISGCLMAMKPDRRDLAFLEVSDDRFGEGQDMTKEGGYTYMLSLVMRLQEGSTMWLSPLTSSWVEGTPSATTRALDAIDGDETVPEGSLLWLFDPMEKLKNVVGSVSRVTHLSAFGAEIVGAIEIVSDSMHFRDLAKDSQPPPSPPSYSQLQQSVSGAVGEGTAAAILVLKRQSDGPPQKRPRVSDGGMVNWAERSIAERIQVRHLGMRIPSPRIETQETLEQTPAPLGTKGAEQLDQTPEPLANELTAKQTDAALGPADAKGDGGAVAVVAAGVNAPITPDSFKRLREPAPETQSSLSMSPEAVQSPVPFGNGSPSQYSFCQGSAAPPDISDRELSELDMFMWMRDTPEKKPNITPQKHMIRSFGPSRSTPSPLPAPGGAKDELLRKAKAAAAVPPTKAEVKAVIKAGKGTTSKGSQKNNTNSNKKEQNIKGVSLKHSTGTSKTGKSEEDLQRVWLHPNFGELRAAFGSQKSYTVFSDEQGKPRLFVEVNESQTSDHASILGKLMKIVVSKKLDKVTSGVQDKGLNIRISRAVVKHLRKHGDDSKQMRAIFSADEIRALYGKFKTARKDQEDVDTEFSGLDDKGDREGKNKAKFEYLTAWVKVCQRVSEYRGISSSMANPVVDEHLLALGGIGREMVEGEDVVKAVQDLEKSAQDPTMEEKFKSMVTRVATGERISRKMLWKPWKQMVDKHGEVRRDPSHPRRKQFLDIEDCHEKSFQKEKQTALSGRSKATDEEFAAIEGGLRKSKLCDDVRRGDWDNMGLDLKDEDEDDHASDPEGFIDFLQAKMRAANGTSSKGDIGKAKKVIDQARKFQAELGDYQAERAPSMEGMRKTCVKMRETFALGKKLKIV
ncbi:unnamed protein product, partial [Prorocentrum cordatum]